MSRPFGNPNPEPRHDPRRGRHAAILGGIDGIQSINES
jgi:hypothetical protein